MLFSEFKSLLPCLFQKFIVKITCLYDARISLFLTVLLLLSGDIHPNPGQTCYTDLKIIHLNTCSVKDKIELIGLELNEYDVICLTETWLHDGVSDNDVLIPGFHCPFRKDRLTRGGGVAVYVKNTLITKRVETLDKTGLEALWIELRHKSSKYLVGVFYRADKSEQYWNLLEQSIGDAMDMDLDTVIVGDFNIDIYNKLHAKINNLMVTYSLHQLINSPTRVTQNSRTLIDLIFVSRLDMVTKSNVLEPFCSDHSPVSVTIKGCIRSTKTYMRKVYDYTLVNKDGICSHVENTDWENALSSPDINVSAAAFVKTLSDICDSNIPNKIVTIRCKDAPWMNNKIVNSCETKSTT